MSRIINDDGNNENEEPEEGSLHDLLDTPISIVKGPRKRTNMSNPCFTVFILSNPRQEDSKAHNGTAVINFYVDNYQEGHANLELLSPVAERLIYLFDDKLLDIEDYRNYNLSISASEGPLRDADDEDAHYMHVRLNYGLI